MCKCNKPSCGGCDLSEGQNLAQLQNIVAEIQDSLNELGDAAKFLLCGHPILLVEEAGDVDSFDAVSGIGTGCWEKWAICNGKTYKNSGGKNVKSPNFINRFIVGAGGKYDVDDTGGLDKVQLITAELPSHNHGVNDAGHTHVVNDPGHDHHITDPGHNHTQNPHHHLYNDVAPNQAGGNLEPLPATESGHNEDLTRTSQDTTAINNPSATGITINANTTGITNSPSLSNISTANVGENKEHENRPPFFAAIYVIRIG